MQQWDGRSTLDPISAVESEPVGPVTPNLTDYRSACQDFSWERARAWAAPAKGGETPDAPRGLAFRNIAYQAVDRHVVEGHGQQTALRCLGRDGSVRDYSYADLGRESARFANVLEA